MSAFLRVHRRRSGGRRSRSRALPAVRVGVRWALEVTVAAGFVIGVYEVVVAGGIALWPTAPDRWILPMWIAAATISGLGLTRVRALARWLLRWLWPGGDAGPHATLAAFVAGMGAVEPAEAALTRLAQLTATGTGARAVTVWLAGPSGHLRPAARWPAVSDVRSHSYSPGEAGIDVASDFLSWTASDVTSGVISDRTTGVDFTALAGLPGVDQVIPVRDAHQLFGALTLTEPPRRQLTPRDLRLATDVANSAAQVLCSAELTARLAEELRRESAQVAQLDRSRRRVAVARDATRAQLGHEIQATVGAALADCAAEVAALLADDPVRGGTRDAEAVLAAMATRTDAAIADFRRIVHGLYPAALTDHGLAAAVDNLLADLPRRAVLRAPALPRLEPRVEVCVYFCVAALLGLLGSTDHRAGGTVSGREQPGRGNVPDVASDAPLLVDIDHRSDELVLTLWDQAAGPGRDATAATTDSALYQAVLDRVEALEGSLDHGGATGPLWRLRVPLPAADPTADRATAAPGAVRTEAAAT